MARLDRLAPAKEVAQAGAAIGRTFRHDLLAAVLTRSDAELRAALEQLVDAGLVFRQGTGTDATYTFKHALVQDAAHGSLLKSRRQRLHARIAAVLEKQFPEEAVAAPEVVAQHYAEGGLDESAVQWWTRAGRQAFERSMNVEAIASLGKALAILDARSDRVGTQESELDILIALGAALTAVQGYASAETQRIVRRAREACRGVRDVDRVIPVLYGEWSTLVGLGRYDDADDVAKELAQFLVDTSSNQFDYIHSVMLAFVHMMRGNLKDSDYFYELAQSQYVCNDGYDIAFKLTEHPGALIHAFWAQTKLCLGQYDMAYKSMLISIEQTTQSKHVNSIGFTKCNAAFVLLERGHFDEALKTCDDAINYAVENSLTIWQTITLVIRGLVMSRLDRNANGVEIARQGLSDWLATGVKVQAAQMQSYFVQACLFEGRIEEAEIALHAGFEIVDETGEKCYLAELYRLQGEARLAQRPALSSQAEACYQRALNLSREQNAKTFELRAAMSLARLWVERGERQRAHDLLAPIYGWFTEGLGTRDLVEAKALLDVLR
jgi:predicted ATPase